MAGNCNQTCSRTATNGRKVKKSNDSNNNDDDDGDDDDDDNNISDCWTPNLV